MSARLNRLRLGAAAANEPPLPLAVYGAGCVGLVTAACFADLGHVVLCADNDIVRIAQLARGQVPFYEPGLEDLILRNSRLGRLRFTNDVHAAAAHGAVQIIAVGTPSASDGSADIGNVLGVARQIGNALQHDALVVCKSTAPVGTAQRVARAIQAELDGRQTHGVTVSVVANPEFLKEGSAVEDFMQPDRVVVGTDDAAALRAMHALYAPLLRQPSQWQSMGVRSAELTKYACNAMLATRISFMNELACLAEQLQVDIEDVRRGMASDPRIGGSFLAPGCGFGGSCLPKDLRALQHLAGEHGLRLPTLAAVEQTNLRQKSLLARRVIEWFDGSLVGRRIALWGLAFKPGTDDLREAPSAAVIGALAAVGARIVAHDPVAMPAARRLHAHRSGLSFAVDAIDAVQGADALLIVTEWPEYRDADWPAVRKRMAVPRVLDGRNICNPERMAELEFEYRGVGRNRFAKIAAKAAQSTAANAQAPPPPLARIVVPVMRKVVPGA